jgi:dienelactone hydrolase
VTPAAARPFVIAGALLAVLPAGAADRPPAVSDEAYRATVDFYQYDWSVPLDVRVVKRDDAPPGYSREKIVFTGGRGDRVPSWLMLPRTGARPFPVVLILDGWMGTKDRWWQDDTWPRGGVLMAALAAEGMAALVLDAQFHGERAENADFQPVERYVCEDCINLRREMFVETVVDYRRALDYLATRDEIDRGRVGALGLSMGGLMTLALSAVDARVKAAVPCVTPARPNERWTARAALSPYAFAPRVTVPTLMLMGRTDELYGQADAESLLAAVGSTDKTLEWFDAGHRLPPEYVPRAVGWLKAHLK